MKTLYTSIWVRFPNFPLHLLHLNILVDVGNFLDHFIKIDLDRLERGIVTFFRICVEIDLNNPLLDKILLEWDINFFCSWWTMRTLLSIARSINISVTFKMPILLLKGPIPSQMPRKRAMDGKIEKIQ